MGSCYNCGQGGISGGNGFCDDNCESEYTDYVKADQSDEPSHSTCDTCGTTEPMDDWHRFYGQCGYCVQDVDPAHRPDQSDNQAADRAVSQTIQVPPDRGGDISRRPGV